MMGKVSSLRKKCAGLLPGRFPSIFPVCRSAQMEPPSPRSSCGGLSSISQVFVRLPPACLWAISSNVVSLARLCPRVVLVHVTPLYKHSAWPCLPVGLRVDSPSALEHELLEARGSHGRCCGSGSVAGLFIGLVPTFPWPVFGSGLVWQRVAENLAGVVFHSWAPYTKKWTVWGRNSGFWTFLSPVCCFVLMLSSSGLVVNSDSSLMFRRKAGKQEGAVSPTGRHFWKPPACVSLAGRVLEPPLATRIWGRVCAAESDSVGEGSWYLTARRFPLLMSQVHTIDRCMEIAVGSVS